MTQIIYRYDSQYILSDSHGRIYNMRDWDSLQVPALAYDSLVWGKPEQSCHMNIKLVSGNNEKKNKTKKLLFLYRIYAYIFLSSPTLQSESVTVTVWVRHDATEVI